MIQFVTFRLAASFPESLRSEWAHLVRISDDAERRQELEAYLDLGRGECHLHKPEVAQLIEDNIRQFAGDRYELRAWVIMPNHVHVLFKVGAVSMSETVGAWKKHTGRLANRLLGISGSFWAKDYFDVYMRNPEQERNTICYIENNPTKSKLVLDPKEWPWSSARHRDAYGILPPPRTATL